MGLRLGVEGEELEDVCMYVGFVDVDVEVLIHGDGDGDESREIAGRSGESIGIIISESCLVLPKTMMMREDAIGKPVAHPFQHFSIFFFGPVGICMTMTMAITMKRCDLFVFSV